MKLTKRLMALLMVVAMLATNLPLGVLATDISETEPAVTEAAVVETAAATEPEAAEQSEAEETTAPTVEETVAETTVDTTEAVVEETTEAVVEETTEETVAETVEETVAETTEETVPETTEEEVEEQPEEAPASTNEPWLSWRWLNNDGNGWYENMNEECYRDDGIMAYGNKWVVPYINLWNDGLGDYEAFPVQLTSNSQYLYICPLTEYEGGHRIQDGEANAAYFIYMEGVNTITKQMAEVSCSYGGQTYTFDLHVMPRYMGYYSTPAATLEGVVRGQTYLDHNSNEKVIYFVNQDPSTYVYQSFDYEIRTFNGKDYSTLCCDGEELVTKTDLGNGVVKFTVNPKYIKYAKESTDYEQFQLTVYGTWKEAGNDWTNNFHQQLTIQPEAYEDHYLTVAWLWNQGQGWYLNEDDMMGNVGMRFGVDACTTQYVMFFLNSLNESTGEWTRTPVVPTTTSPYVTIERVVDCQNENQPMDGEQYGDYFLRIKTHGTLDTTKFYLDVANGSETLNFPSTVWERPMHFFSANVYNVNYVVDAATNLGVYDTAKTLYLLKDPDFNLQNVRVNADDWGGELYQYTDGEPLITVTEITGGWKIDVNPKFVQKAIYYKNYRWLNLHIWAEADVVDDNGNVQGGAYAYLNVYPPLERSSFLMMRYLDYNNGWYNPYNAPQTDMGMGAASEDYVIFYYVPWNAYTQTYGDPVPVIPTSNNPNLTISTLSSLGYEIQEGAQDSAYYCLLRSNTLDYTVTEITALGGGAYIKAPFHIYERELAFYGAPSISMDTILSNGQYGMSADEGYENAVYLLFKDAGERQLQNMNWYVHTWDQRDYTDFAINSVTMEEISNGYKFIIDREFVEAALEGRIYDNWMNFNIVVEGDMCDSEGNKLYDFYQEVLCQPPEPGNDPYITAHHLQNDGDGFYVYHVSSEDPTRNFGTRAMDCNWMIFYLHTWNASTQSWESTPIIPETDSDKLTIATFDKLDGKYGDATIREDQTLGEYFVNVEAWGTLDYSKEYIYYDYNGTTVKAPFHIHTRDLSFYDSDEISVESCMPDRQFDIDKTSEETVVYFRTYNTDGWYIDDVQWEVDTWGEDYFQYTYGEPLVHMVELGDGTGYEFIVNQNYVNWVRGHYKFDWKNFRLHVTGNWYNENGELMHEFQDDCWINPPQDTDPWICAYRLENQGEGWFPLEDSITTEYGTRGLDWSWYIFFLNTWNEEKQGYEWKPIIPETDSENLTITKLLELPEDDPHEKIIREDYAATDRPDYFLQIRSYNYIDGEHHEMLYYTDDAGNTYELPFTIYHRETGYYTEPTRSVDSAIVYGEYTLDSKLAENAVYYLFNTPYEHTYENVSFRVDTWGQDYSAMYCDGEDLISWEPVTGGYKIVINPKYVQAMASGTDWRNFCIWAEWDRVSPDGHVDHENWENIWISPPERFDPYLSWGYLDDNGDGYFFDSNNPDRWGGKDHYWRFEMSGMNNRWVTFFLNTYNESAGEWTRTPFVPTITGENIKMYTLPEGGFEIAEGAEYAEYYRLIKSRGSLNGSTFTIGCESVPGYEDLTFTGYVIDREVAFYTTLEPSVDTILHEGFTTLSAEGENVFYISKLFDDAELRNFKLDIDTWGEDYNRFCDGEKFVTVEETARGYKITVNPKYVQYVKDHVHDNWKNFCLYFETDVYNGNGDFIITWGDVLWVNPPELANDLNDIVNSETMTNEEKKDAVQNMDTGDLKDAMEKNENVVEQIKKLEDEVGTKVTVETLDEPPITDAEIIGAGLNKVENPDEDITLEIGQPKEEKPKEEIEEKYDSSVNVQFSMTLDNVQNTEKLDVPVMVTLEVPAGVNIDLLVLLHYHGTGVEQVNFSVSVKDGKTYITFALDGFSDFVMTHQKTGDVNKDGSINDSDAIYVIWHTLFPEMYPLSVAAADMPQNGILDGAITEADAMEILWKALDLA